MKPQHFQTVVHTLCNELLSFIVLCIALLYISASQDDASCTNTVKRIKKKICYILSYHWGGASTMVSLNPNLLGQMFPVDAPPLPCRWRRISVPSLEPTRALLHQKSDNQTLHLGSAYCARLWQSARRKEFKKKIKKSRLWDVFNIVVDMRDQ